MLNWTQLQQQQKQQHCQQHCQGLDPASLTGVALQQP
jgi:hypothetical protein